jgi:hypothetical protein
VDYKNTQKGRTGLILAARKGHLECVKVMMKLRLTSITRIRSKRALCCTL